MASPTMSEDKRIATTTGGAIGISVFASFIGLCCIGPWAVVLFGVSGAVTNGSLGAVAALRRRRRRCHARLGVLESVSATARLRGWQLSGRDVDLDQGHVVGSRLHDSARILCRRSAVDFS